VEKTRTQIERQVWNADRGQFVPTGEMMNADTATFEKAADRLSASRGRFLKGPVPWCWIVTAASLPGKALVVGLCLWRLAGATKSQTVPFGNADLQPFGVDRASKSRALRALEDAGLIEAAHKPGRFPKVTLLSPPRGEAARLGNPKRASRGGVPLTLRDAKL
jgi:DNA-binding transcriptional ArsR family regulator